MLKIRVLVDKSSVNNHQLLHTCLPVSLKNNEYIAKVRFIKIYYPHIHYMTMNCKPHTQSNVAVRIFILSKLTY